MRRLRELALGARLTLAGGRESLVRTGLTALGVGLGVALLLGAASVPHAVQAREDRGAARLEVVDGPGALLLAHVDTQFRGDWVIGAALRPRRPEAPLPPGLARFPAPGELIVSPALERLLRSPAGALLRARLPGRIAGTIGDAGLRHPRELAFYAGNDELTARTPEVMQVRGFGGVFAPPPVDPMAYLIGTVAVLVLLAPIAVFVATAVRFGGESRDRRLAAIRLAGADRAMAARIAAGEALVGALAGLAIGAALFLAARPLAERISIFDLSVFAVDVRPSAVLVAAIALLVPAAAVLVTLLALRRVVIEPLGVVRRSRARRRRLVWRLALPAAGLVLLYPLLDGLESGGDRETEIRLMAGVGLLLAGLTALLPWLVEAAVARLRGGGLPWQLATRRLQLDSGAAVRAVSGIAVAVAGAIALQMLFASVEHEQRAQAASAGGSTGVFVQHVRAGDRADRVEAALADAPGVRSVLTFEETFLSTPGREDHLGSLLIAGCDVLRRYAALDRCRDGDTFVVSAENAGIPELPRPGDVVAASARVRWRVPAAARTAAALPDPPGWQRGGVFATPAAVPDRIRRLAADEVHATLAGGPDAIEHARNAVAAVDPLASVNALELDDASELSALRRGLLAAAVAVLAVIGASLLIGAVEQVRERRRLLAALVAVGVRRGTLAWSVLIQTAIPVLLGLALAIATGVGLGALLLEIASEPLRLDAAGIAALAGAGAAVVLLVTVLTLPALARWTRPDGLRTE